MHINKIYTSVYLHARCVSTKARFNFNMEVFLSTHGKFTTRPEVLRNYLVPPAKFRVSVLNLDKTISCHKVSNELPSLSVDNKNQLDVTFCIPLFLF
jgi:hypothetical protein